MMLVMMTLMVTVMIMKSFLVYFINFKKQPLI